MPGTHAPYFIGEIPEFSILKKHVRAQYAGFTVYIPIDVFRVIVAAEQCLLHDYDSERRGQVIPLRCPPAG